VIIHRPKSSIAALFPLRRPLQTMSRLSVILCNAFPVKIEITDPLRRTRLARLVGLVNQLMAFALSGETPCPIS